MALRRELWQRLGGFDEMLGAGGCFGAGEEGDFALRALRGGYHVYETPEVVLTHLGFRTWEEGRRLIPNYWYGTGAMFAKKRRGPRRGSRDAVVEQYGIRRSTSLCSLLPAGLF